MPVTLIVVAAVAVWVVYENWDEWFGKDPTKPIAGTHWVPAIRPNSRLFLGIRCPISTNKLAVRAVKGDRRCLNHYSSAKQTA